MKSVLLLVALFAIFSFCLADECGSASVAEQLHQYCTVVRNYSAPKVGKAGPRGKIGLTGPRGLKGDVGPQGGIGMQGPRGLTGPLGPVGPRGVQGQLGPPGPRGSKGLIGPQGPVGSKGVKGQLGPPGPRGSKGERGPNGDATMEEIGRKINEYLVLLPAALASEKSTRIRLRGGNAPNEGRVEVYYSGSWGTVCDDDFGSSDATVACKQLGFQSYSSYFGSAHFGQGSGTIWLDDLACYGSESALSSCSGNSWGSHNCGHGEDVSVRCR